MLEDQKNLGLLVIVSLEDLCLKSLLVCKNLFKHFIMGFLVDFALKILVSRSFAFLVKMDIAC